MSPTCHWRRIDRVQRASPGPAWRTYGVLGQHRSTRRHVLRSREDEACLVADTIGPARHDAATRIFRIAALSRDAGW